MAIAFDAATRSVTSVVQVSSVSWSHTCTGSDRFLVVPIFTQGTSTVTGVTYDGASMILGESITLSSNSAFKAHIYYLANPSSGSNTVTVTNGGSMFTVAGALSYTGVDQTTPVNATSSSQKLASSTSTTHTATSTVDGCWAVSFTGNQRATAAGTGSTARVTSIYWGISFCDTDGAASPAGLISMTQTYSSITNMIGVMLVMAPASGGGGGGFTKPNYLGFSRL